MFEKYNLEDKYAVVTGGAGLLGRQHCLALLELGCNVICADLSDDNLKSFQIELPSNYTNQITFKKLDVSSENAIIEFVNSLHKIDILVNNAAIDAKVDSENSLLSDNKFETFELKKWNDEILVGLTGAMICSKHFGNKMLEGGGGVILNIASDLSVISPNQNLYKNEKGKINYKPVTYSVIKTGLIGLTRYLATYWADQNIRVNALSPGGVYNDQDDNFVTKIEKVIPMGRMANKDEYKSAIKFLCTDASSYMTGQNLIIDGGRTVW